MGGQVIVQFLARNYVPVCIFGYGCGVVHAKVTETTGQLGFPSTFWAASSLSSSLSEIRFLLAFWALAVEAYMPMYDCDVDYDRDFHYDFVYVFNCC